MEPNLLEQSYSCTLTLEVEAVLHVCMRAQRRPFHALVCRDHRDHTNTRILQTSISAIPLVLGLELKREILMFVRSFGPVICLQRRSVPADSRQDPWRRASVMALLDAPNCYAALSPSILLKHA